MVILTGLIKAIIKVRQIGKGSERGEKIPGLNIAYVRVMNNYTLAGKNILITGGAGFIGSHLAERIAEEEPRGMVVMDNLFLGKEKNLEQAIGKFPKLKFYPEDATSLDKVTEIIEKHNIDVVFDLAVVPLPASLERPKWAFAQNMRMTEVICELAEKKKFRTLVHFSSSEVYGTALYCPMDEFHPLLPLTPYGASKAGGDHLVYSYVHSFGIDTVIVRPFNNYGPRQNEGMYAGVIPATIRRILNGENPIIYGDGKQTRDFIYVEDTAEASIALFKTPEARGKIINVANGFEIKIIDLIRIIQEKLGYQREIIFEEDRPCDVRRHAAGTQILQELIQYKPKVSFAEGIERTVDWYIENLKPML